MAARHLVLVGLMGAGKTTVGRALRRRASAGRSSTPTSWSRRRPGMRVAEIFEHRGRGGVPRARARRGRRRVRVAGAARDRVRWRRGARRREPPAACAAGGVVVWLRGAARGARRAGRRDGDRPAAAARAAPPRPRSTRLARAARARVRGGRRTCTVDTDGRSRRRGRRPRSSQEYRGVERVTRRGSTPPYDVVVGAGALAEAGAVLAGRRRVAVVSQAGVADCHAPRCPPRSSGAGVDHRPVPHGRRRGRQVARHRRRPLPRLAAWGLLRGDAVVALGGGVVGDTAGFAAAVYHRGVAVRAGADHAARAGRRRHRRQDRGQPARGQEPGRRVPPADRGARRRRARSPRCRRASTAPGSARWRSTRLMPGGERVADARPRARRRGRRARRRRARRARGRVRGDQGRRRRGRSRRSAPASAPRSTSATRSRTRSRSVGGYELLHGEAVAIGLVFAGALAGALRADRRRGRRAPPQRASPRSTSRPRCPARPTAERSCSRSMRRDKKAVGGLTFVLPGPMGLETVHDPDRARARRRVPRGRRGGRCGRLRTCPCRRSSCSRDRT